MFKKAVFPGKYIQGVGALGELPGLIRLLGRQGLILASPSVKNQVLPACGIDWQAQAISVEEFRGECCEPELARLESILKE
ncbi:MAG TPA: glycerol dehydrogenase, partial [Verrucomicrobiota bacterium]|nr:glycerol dehydrogenase [Verrucomicrobiota bacterium]